MGNNFNLTPYYHSFVGIDRLFNELNRFIDEPKSVSGYPPCNVIRNGEDHYVIELAVAGFAQEDIDMHVKDGILTVEAAKKEADEREYLHKGIGTRAFSRTFRLADHMEVKGADLRNGMLTVTLERVVPEEAKPKRIAIAAI